MKNPIPGIVAWSLAASAACAACPTQADLAHGIELKRNDPFLGTVWTTTDQGLTEARMTERDGEVSDVSAIYAHALAVTHRIDESGTLELVYETDPSTLDALQIGQLWHSTLRLLYDGSEIADGTVSITRLEDGEQTVGECTYRVWIVRSEQRLSGFSDTNFDYVYAPGLGLNLAAIRLDDRGDPVTGVFFDTIRAR
ncbi:hypothetical protein [Roseicyclus amphidinii]|uniref:hypothetical protein n=1 Tax=Roseicyclus amphidinii TaxID=3034232 RepID=UPI0024E1139A|nr:hypothetical protein [Roseicyclus sp. Amp-Y-6]